MNAAIERQGTVVGLSNGMATIRLETPAACGGCASRTGCGSAAGGARLLTLPAAPALRPGDAVRVSLPAAVLAPAALLGYLLPLLALLAGAVIGELGWGSDAAAVGGAALGFLGGLALARSAARRLLGPALSPGLHTLAACSAAPADFPPTASPFFGEPR